MVCIDTLLVILGATNQLDVRYAVHLGSQAWRSKEDNVINVESYYLYTYFSVPCLFLWLINVLNFMT